MLAIKHSDFTGVFMYEVRSYLTTETCEGYFDMTECQTKKDAIGRAKQALTEAYQIANEVPVKLVTIVKAGTDDVIEEFHYEDAAQHFEYPPKTKQNAIDAYIEKTAYANELVQILKDRIGDHMGTDPDDITWAHVGTLNKVIADTKEILKFINAI
jgi:uncharacterized protein (UPF0333 family)